MNLYQKIDLIYNEYYFTYTSHNYMLKKTEPLYSGLAHIGYEIHINNNIYKVFNDNSGIKGIRDSMSISSITKTEYSELNQLMDSELIKYKRESKLNKILFTNKQ